MSTYPDKVNCPKGHCFIIDRRFSTAGRKVRTYCRRCQQAYQIMAGKAPTGGTP